MNCDPRLACLYFALIAVILILVLMQVWKVGYYKNNSNAVSNTNVTGERFLGPTTGAKPNSRRRTKHDNPMFNRRGGPSEIPRRRLGPTTGAKPNSRRSEKFANCGQARQSNNALGISDSDMGLLGQSGFTL